MRKTTKILPLIVSFIALFLLSLPYYSGDVKNHLVWAKSIVNEGTLNFYQREFHNFAFPNYPPLAMLAFAISLKLYQLLNQLAWYLNIQFRIFPSNLIYLFEWENTLIAFLKLPAILSNIAIALGLYFLTSLKERSEKIKIIAAASFLLNPASLYLSVIWGQIDLMAMAFLVFAVLALYKNCRYTSSLLVVLALLSKQTVIVFLPVFVWIYFKKFNLLATLKSLFFMIIIFYLFYLPFNQQSILWPFTFYKQNFNLVAASVGENAINLWGMLYNFERVFDGEKLLGLTLQQVGYSMFFLIIVTPSLVFIKKRASLKRGLEYMLIITLVYFLVLTRMHERYLAPAVVFSSFLWMVKKRYAFSFIFFSTLHFLNLYRGLYQPDIAFLKQLVTSNLFLSTLVSIYILVATFYLYKFIKDEG